MRALGRALMARCPVCGAGGIWATYGTTLERCPGCDYAFSREEGYWVGAMIINIAIPMAIFVVGLVGGAWLLWPDVPWNALTVALVITMGLAPIVFYRQSKTLWVWLDQRIHPYAPEERDWTQR